MNKEMRSYFNLSDNPFTKDIKIEHLHLLPSIDKNLKILNLLVETRGIGVMTGKSGTGKSALVRILKSKLNTGLYKILYICHTSIGVTEFYSHLCTGLGLEPSGRRSMMFRNVKERILTLNKTDRIHPVLIIDEAHLLSNEILQEIRLLTNFEIDSYSGLTVLFCGQESFTMKLGLSILESLANTISINIHVDSLVKEEAFAYIEKRVLDCGNNTPIFSKNAMSLVHQASGGILRIINNISNAALIKAFYMKSALVEAEHVQSVIER